jgi:hypothetical protein
MRGLYIPPTKITPEINLNPDDEVFLIRGISSPEDVRSLYYPVIEWIRIFVDDLLDGEYVKFNESNPVRLQIDLSYFNSSSAKFLFDIFSELRRLPGKNSPVVTEWFYDAEDGDMKDAGIEISELSGTKFNLIPKYKTT